MKREGLQNAQVQVITSNALVPPPLQIHHAAIGEGNYLPGRAVRIRSEKQETLLDATEKLAFHLDGDFHTRLSQRFVYAIYTSIHLKCKTKPDEIDITG